MTEPGASMAAVENAHVLAGSSDRANGKSTADKLAEYGQIRVEPTYNLRATVVESKAYDLVGDQQQAELPGQSADSLNEVRGAGDHADAIGQDIDEDAGKLVLVTLEQGRRSFDVVVWQHDYIGKDPRWQ